jgi:thioredoxin-dependent peroxiredoxin
MSQERANVITFKGNPMTLIGPEINVGDQAPECTLIATDLSAVKLSDSKGKTRIVVTVPSLDTPVCDIEAQRFNSEAAKLPNTEVLIVSLDLPFAQKRWCGNLEGQQANCKTLSDYRGAELGNAFGLIIKELHLLTRAVFVIDANNKVLYKEIVAEVTHEPNYNKALEAAGALASA